MNRGNFLLLVMNTPLFVLCDKTHLLPVATDATCSGLQILAGLCRDKSTAQLVNVLPSDAPQDAYKSNS